MKCPLCGKETPVGQRCEECGADISKYKQPETTLWGGEHDANNDTPKGNQAKKPDLYLILGLSGAGLVVLILLIVAVSSCNKSKSDTAFSNYSDSYDYNDDYDYDYDYDYESEFPTFEIETEEPTEETEEPTEKPTEEPTEPPTEAPKIINNTSTDGFWAKGSGDFVAQGLKVTGYGILHITHTGSRNFTVKLYDGDDYKNLLVNEIGNYSGDVFVDGSGTYQLVIKADGNWNITSDGLSIDDTTSFSGHGDSITGITSHSGGSWKITNSGDHYFSVKEYGLNYGYMTLLVNEIGNYSGVVKAESGDDIFFVVKSDGNWTIEKQ